MKIPHWFRVLLRLTPILVGTSVVAVLGLLAFRAISPFEDFRASSDAIGTYLQTVGGIYAVLLAFVVYVVWGQFNEARSYVDREAAALVDLHRTASGLPAESRLAIQRGLREYVTAVLEDEWEAMRHNDVGVIERVEERLDAVWLAIHACRPCDGCQHTIYGEVLSRFNDLTDLRTNRLTSAHARIPLQMNILLYAGGVIVTGSLYFVNIEPLWVHATLAAALAAAIAHILFLVVHLDDAFAGEVLISKHPFERARETFAKATHQVDAASAAA